MIKNNTTIHDAILELVEAIRGKVFFERLVQMLPMPFFKHIQNSVIPFPVKYLREWCAILGFFEEEKEEDDAAEQKKRVLSGRTSSGIDVDVKYTTSFCL